MHHAIQYAYLADCSIGHIDGFLKKYEMNGFVAVCLIFD